MSPLTSIGVIAYLESPQACLLGTQSPFDFHVIDEQVFVHRADRIKRCQWNQTAGGDQVVDLDDRMRAVTRLPPDRYAPNRMNGGLSCRSSV